MNKKSAFYADMAIGLALTALVIYVNRSFPMHWSQRLCDGLFVAAVMLLGIGGIRFTSSKGYFDMMGYSIRYVFFLVIPAAAPRGEEKEDLYAYKARKDQKRKSPNDLLLSGLIFLILAFICFGIYSFTA